MTEVYNDNEVQVTDKVVKAGEKVYQVGSLSGLDILTLPTAGNVLGIIPLYYGILAWVFAIGSGIVFMFSWQGLFLIPMFAFAAAGWPLIRLGNNNSVMYRLRADVSGTKRVLIKDANRERLERILQAIENVLTGSLEPVSPVEPGALSEETPPTELPPAADTSNHVKLPTWLSWLLGGALFGFLALIVWGSFQI